MKFYKYINTIPDKPIVGGEVTEFNPGDTIMVRRGTQANYYWEQYKVAADGLVYFVRGITNDQWGRMERLNNTQITKLEGLGTQEEINDQIQDSADEINSRIDNLQVGYSGSVTTDMSISELNALEDGIYRAQTSGEYANGLTAKEGFFTTFRKQGNEWTLESEVESQVLADGEVEEGNEKPLSGGTAYNDIFDTGQKDLKAVLLNKGKLYPFKNYYVDDDSSRIRLRKAVLDVTLYANNTDEYNYVISLITVNDGNSGNRIDVQRKSKDGGPTVTFSFRTIGASANNSDDNDAQLSKLSSGNIELITLVPADNSFKIEIIADTSEFENPEQINLYQSVWVDLVFEDSVYKTYEIPVLEDEIVKINTNIDSIAPLAPVPTDIELDILSQIVLRENGEYASSIGGNASQKIPIDRTKKYIVSGQMTATSATLVAYYDGDDVFLGTQFPSTDGSTFTISRQELVIPDDAVTMAFSSYSPSLFKLETLELTQAASLEQVNNIEDEISVINTNIEEISNKLPFQYIVEEDIVLDTSVGRWIRKQTGEIEIGGSAYARDYEPIDKSKNYYFTGRILGVQGVGVAFRDINDEFILQPNDYIFNAVGGTKNLVREPIIIPDNAESWAFSAWGDFVIESGVSVTAASSVEVEQLDDRVTILESETAGSDILLKSIQYDISITNKRNELHGEYLRKLEENPNYQAPIYGVEWNEDITDPNAMTRLGESILHQNLPIQSKIRNCITKDGVVQYYLHPSSKYLREDGVTPSVLDGTDGDVMVEIPEFFYRAQDLPTEGGVIKRIEICEEGVTGFLYSPKQYISAYQCTVDRDLQRLASVCSVNYTKTTEEVFIETSARYVEYDNTGFSLGVQTVYEIDSYTSNASRFRGNVNDASLDEETDPASQDYCRNNLGRPVAAINRKTARAYASNSKGFIQQYDNYKALYFLITVEYATRQLQQPIITERDSNGFTQGGLGQGAVKYPDYAGYEKHFSPQGGTAVIPNGITNELGSNSGEVYFRIKNAPILSDGSGISAEILEWGDILMPVNSYRGIENIYGHLYNIIDNVDARITNRPASIKDVVYYYQPNPHLTNDSDSKAGYSTIWSGSFISSIRVIKNLLWGRNGHILPIEEGGSGAAAYQTYYTDCVELTGTWNGNISGGIFYLTLNGRIVSNQLVGLLFWVGVVNADSDRFRTSDTVRLQYFDF